MNEYSEMINHVTLIYLMEFKKWVIKAFQFRKIFISRLDFFKLIVLTIKCLL